MTLSETAEYLKVAEKTIHRMIKEKKIPCARVGSQWRFIKTQIDEWLFSNMESSPKDELTSLLESGEMEISLSRILHSVVCPLKGDSKKDILAALMEPLVSDGQIGNPERYLKKLLEREAMVSTAVGKGIAIPHLRDPKESGAKSPSLVVGISKEGVDFDALDGKAAHIFFMVHTDSVVLHLKILSRINLLIRDKKLHQQMLQCKDADEVVNSLLAAETAV